MQDKISDSIDNSIHIVLSIYNLSDDYLRHAAATILSALSNTKSPITFHLLHVSKESEKNEGKSKLNEEKLNTLATGYGTNIYIHNVNIPDWFYNLKAMRMYHVGTLLRLFIPDCLDDLSKVIYLDCDIIINLDINELWNIDITNYPLAACIDTKFPQNLGLKRLSPKVKKTYTNLKSDNPYFNAGVLLLNLDYLRKKHNLAKESCEYLSKNPTAVFSDQDALNYLFSSNYLQLDKKFNIFQDELNQGNIQYCCIHYAAQSKPWIVYKNSYDDYYWKYLLETPWAEPDPITVKYIRDAPDYEQTRGFASLPTKKQIKIILKLINASIHSLVSKIKILFSIIF